MKSHIEVKISAGCLENMTHAQLDSLQQNILADGLWETQTAPVRISGGDYLGVEVGGIFIGIERDGYTHS